ncbi:MAG: serine/threonine-protein kinase [Pleurocapsa sp. MO_226.B13]|nr:serine/threonine-protein kinase [Pleurocapsa sp. MO_226.B13]
MSDRASDSSRPKPKETLNELGLNLSQADDKTTVEPNSSKLPRTPFVRKDFLEGKTIGDRDRYLLQTLLGQGGMSKVYQALDTKFEDRVVAIKLMTNYSTASGKHLIKRFMGEIKAISCLKHPNIIQVFDFGVTSDRPPFYGAPFYVMEHLEGKTLQNLLTEKRTVPLDSLLNIISQICAGLKEAHQKGIVHRDLKPDNIFLVAGGALGEIVKILDFGIAKNISADAQNSTQLTKEGTFIGTYRYASPEQCRGLANIDQRSDIYSLGIILYEAISGRNPYSLDNDFAPSQADWIASHIRVPPKPLKEQPGCEQIASELASMVMKCLAKSPEDRFSNTEELLNAFTNSFSVRKGNDDAQTATRAEIRDSKVAPKPKQPIREVTLDEKPEVSSNFSASSSGSSEDLKSSQASILTPVKKSGLLIGAGITAVLASIFAGYTYISNRHSYLQAQEALKQIEVLWAGEKYQECIQQAETFPQDYSDLHNKAEVLLDECQQQQEWVERQRQLAEVEKPTEKSRFKEPVAENKQKVELTSDRGIDYSQLRDYLEAGNLKAADLETREVILQAAEGGYLTNQSIQNFPCNDLKTINSLWHHYTQGRFGFSIQNQEYQKTKSSFNSLGDRLGWRQGDWMTYDYLWEKFNPNVPPGYLPARVFRRETGAGMWYRTYIRGILDRTNDCGI